MRGNKFEIQYFGWDFYYCYSILSDIVGVVDLEDRREAVEPEDGIISESDACASSSLRMCSSRRMSDTGLRGASPSSGHPVGLFSK